VSLNDTDILMDFQKNIFHGESINGGVC